MDKTSERPAAEQARETNPPPLEISASRQFTGWLSDQKTSLAFTTYQAGRFFLVGQKEGGRLSLFERYFERCMGLYIAGDTIYIGARYQLWRFKNALNPGRTHNGYDRLFIPRIGYTTGDIDAHDIAVDGEGRTIFVNTLFSCLATVDADYSFRPIWKPPFITKLAAEDRCHLNGLAMEGGRPKYVTAVSKSDVSDGWRDRRADGGCVIDVESNEIVCAGLSMPHSPRIYRGELWVLNSGNGEFGIVDPATGTFEALTFCPGYARGLAFIGDYAVIGLSLPRDGSFQGLPLDERLKERDAEARCGLLVVDLRSGDIVQWLRIGGVITELFDVGVLPGVRRPMSLGFKTDEVSRYLTVGPSPDLSAWIDPEPKGPTVLVH